jgi:hypothetical protein
LGTTDLIYGLIEDSSEHRNERSESIKSEEFLYLLSDWYILGCTL